MAQVVFKYQPTERQLAFHKTFSLHKMYGGAAGGGKTDALLGELILNCIRFPGIKQLFIRKTLSQVEEIIEERLPKMLVSDSGERPYTIRKNVLHFNNSQIILGYWQDDKKNDRYFSTEYDVIAVDEITRTIYTVQEMQKLLIRNRTTKPELVAKGFKAYFMCATNPGGLGHLRVKETWIDQKIWTGYKPEDFAFIPAKLEDNPHLLANDPMYARRLDSMADENLRKAMRHGDWNIFEGQFFPEYMEQDVVVDKFAPVGQYKRTILCLDYGYRKPSAVYLLRRDGDGRMFVSSELYETQLTYDDLGLKMKKQFASFSPDYVIADPAIFAKNGSENSGAERLQATTGWRILPANNNRQAGRTLLKTLLKSDRIYVHTSCGNFKREIVGAVYDKKSDNDLDSNGSDHALDAVRYGLMDIAGDATETYTTEIVQMNEEFVKLDSEDNNLLLTQW